MGQIFVNLFDCAENEQTTGETCYGSCNCNCNTCYGCNCNCNCDSCYNCYEDCGSNCYC